MKHHACMQFHFRCVRHLEDLEVGRSLIAPDPFSNFMHGHKKQAPRYRALASQAYSDCKPLSYTSIVATVNLFVVRDRNM